MNTFFAGLVDNFLINGFCRIQSSGTKWERIRIESALKTETAVRVKNLKKVYGLLKDELFDTHKMFQFNLIPSKGGNTRRFYLHGTPDSLNYFDSNEQEHLNSSVNQIENLFISLLGDENCSYRFVTLSKRSPTGIESIRSAQGIRLHIFKPQKNVSKDKTSNLRAQTKFK